MAFEPSVGVFDACILYPFVTAQEDPVSGETLYTYTTGVKASARRLVRAVSDRSAE